MRIERLVVVALALAVPVVGRAEPVSAAIAAITLADVVGFAVTAALGGAISFGLQAVAGALAGGGRARQADVLANFAQDVAYFERGYGRVRKGGPIGFTGAVDQERHYTVLIAAHSTVGPVEHRLDERVVEIDEEGEVVTEPIAVGDRSQGSIRAYAGQSGQVADAALVAAFDEITEAHDYAGLSYAAITARRPFKGNFSEVYPNYRDNAPWSYLPVWDMHDRVWDPRTETYGWTQNAALIFAHEVTTYLGRDVDWEEIAAEADICDELVTNGDGGTQRRWTVNGWFDDGMTWDEVQARLLMACDGFVYERPDGAIGLKVGRWVEPSLTLTAADFLSVTVSEGQDLGAPSEAVVIYREPANGHRAWPTGTLIADAAVEPARLQSEAHLVDSHNQACRLSKRLLRLERARYQVSGTLKVVGYDAIGERFVRFAHAELGVTCVLEIVRLIRGRDGVTFQLEARSVEADDFAFVAATEEPARPASGVVVSSDDVATVAGFAGVAVQSTGGSAAIRWSWDDVDERYALQIRVRAPGAGIDDWQVTEIPEGGASRFRMSGLLDGATYEAQIRNRTAARRFSDWAPETPISVVAIADNDAPDDLEAFAAVADGSDVDLTWTAPNDSQFYAVRIYRADDSTDFDDAVLVRTEYGLPGNADAWTDESLAAGDYAYWAEPINASGVAGDLSGPSPITII